MLCDGHLLRPTYERLWSRMAHPPLPRLYKYNRTIRAASRRRRSAEGSRAHGTQHGTMAHGFATRFKALSVFSRAANQT